MAWRSGETPHSDSLTECYIAPSWSWASQLSTKVEFRILGRERRELVEVIDVKTTLAGKNPYGAVRYGSITLTCWMIRFRASPTRIDISSRSRASIDSELDDQIKASFATRKWLVMSYLDTQYVKVLLSDRVEACRSRVYYILPLSFGPSEDLYDPMSVPCLLLEAVTPSSGCYQRVGLLQLLVPVIRLIQSNESGESDDVLKERAELPLTVAVENEGLWEGEKSALHELFGMIQKVAHVEVPSHGRTDDGRHTITLL